MLRVPLLIGLGFGWMIACGSSDSEDHGHAGGVDGAAAGNGGADGVSPARVGDPCTTATACPAGGSGTPVCLTDFPDGYCAIATCTDHGHDCPEDPGLGKTATTGSQCVLAPSGTCLALCGDDTDCRVGYSCQPRSDAAGHVTARVCLPKSTGQAGSGGMAAGTGGGMMDAGMMDAGMMEAG